MTLAQKETVYNLRLQGLGYKAIARELLLSVDAVKSYCKRHHLTPLLHKGGKTFLQNE